MEKSSVSSKHSDHQSYPSFAVDSRLPQPTETRPVNPTTALRLSGLPAMGSAGSHPEFLRCCPATHGSTTGISVR